MERDLKFLFSRIYQDYLAWFQERARDGADPIDEEQLIRYQIHNEDAFENASYLLNRIYFVVPLSPSQSRSGSMELFAFSELNLLVKGTANGISDEVLDMYPVEYRRE